MNTSFLKNVRIVAITALSLIPLSVFAAGGLVPCDGPDCNLSSLIGLVQNILKFFSIIVYMTARGDTGQIGKAHKLFGYAVGGLVIVLAAWLIVYAIMKGLNVDSQYWFLSQ